MIIYFISIAEFLKILTESKLCSLDGIPLYEPAVCVQQVLVFLGVMGLRILYFPSACSSPSSFTTALSR